MGSRIYTQIWTLGDISLYQVTGSPNGSLTATRGSLATRDDAAQLWQNTDGGTTWQQLGSGGGGSANAIVVNDAVDLSSIGTNYIKYDTIEDPITQPLPEISSSPFVAFFVSLYDAVSITFEPQGSDTILGTTTLDSGGYSHGVYIHNGSDTWVWFGEQAL